MATKFDNIFRPLARKLVNETFGTSATLIRTENSYDVATGKNVPTETSYSVKISPPAPVAENRITGVVAAGDAATYLAASEVAIKPRTEDRLVWDGKTWQIVQVNELVSGDLKAAFEVVIRG